MNATTTNIARSAMATLALVGAIYVGTDSDSTRITDATRPTTEPGMVASDTLATDAPTSTSDAPYARQCRDADSGAQRRQSEDELVDSIGRCVHIDTVTAEPTAARSNAMARDLNALRWRAPRKSELGIRMERAYGASGTFKITRKCAISRGSAMVAACPRGVGTA
jgi:hypothetical protein